MPARRAGIEFANRCQSNPSASRFGDRGADSMVRCNRDAECPRPSSILSRRWWSFSPLGRRVASAVVDARSRHLRAPAAAAVNNGATGSRCARKLRLEIYRRVSAYHKLPTTGTIIGTGGSRASPSTLRTSGSNITTVPPYAGNGGQPAPIVYAAGRRHRASARPLEAVPHRRRDHGVTTGQMLTIRRGLSTDGSAVLSET